MLDTLEVPLALEQLDLALQQIDRVTQHRLERLHSALPHQRVRILSRRQGCYPDPNRVAQKLITRAKGGPQPGRSLS